MFVGFEFIRMGDYLIFGILIILLMLSTKQIMAALICTLVFVAIVMLVLKGRKAKVENTTCTLYEKKADYKTKDKEKVIEYKDIKDIGYSKKFPVIFTVITTENKVCDIAVIRHIEQETVFKKLDNYSRADKIIMVLENDNYNKNLIDTTKEVLICLYPIKIVDVIN